MGSRANGKEEKSSPPARGGTAGRDEEIARLLRENLELRIRAEIKRRRGIEQRGCRREYIKGLEEE